MWEKFKPTRINKFFKSLFILIIITLFVLSNNVDLLSQEEMTKAGINVIGAVLNKVKIPRLGSYHYYYYYGKYTKK